MRLFPLVAERSPVVQRPLNEFEIVDRRQSSLHRIEPALQSSLLSFSVLRSAPHSFLRLLGERLDHGDAALNSGLGTARFDHFTRKPPEPKPQGAQPIHEATTPTFDATSSVD